MRYQIHPFIHSDMRHCTALSWYPYIASQVSAGLSEVKQIGACVVGLFALLEGLKRFNCLLVKGLAASSLSGQQIFLIHDFRSEKGLRLFCWISLEPFEPGQGDLCRLG